MCYKATRIASSENELQCGNGGVLLSTRGARPHPAEIYGPLERIEGPPKNFTSIESKPGKNIAVNITREIEITAGTASMYVSSIVLEGAGALLRPGSQYPVYHPGYFFPYSPSVL